MTGICAFVGNRAGEAKSRVDTMLGSMQARGTVLKSFKAVTGKTGNLAIGICDTSEQSTESRRQNPEVVLDGAFFVEDPPAILGMNSVLDWLQIPGAFSFLGFKGGDLLAGRDPLGQKPLYWGADQQGNYAFASLRAALNDIGMPDPNPVHPGQLISVSDRGPIASTTHVLTRPSLCDISEADALDQLERLLLESVHRMVPEESALAFSGGLDSALVAVACKKAGIEPKLVTVGLDGQAELQHAVLSANSIGLQTHIERFSGDDVMNALPHVVRTVESHSPVTVGISVPFYFACQKAKELGAKAIVAGQLSDELYGGYARFEKFALEGNLERAEGAMWDSVLAASTGDFEPGDKLAVSFGLELRCPFAYAPLVNQALQLPMDFRLRVVNNAVKRKYILRKLAARWGLPASIVNRPKKAFQYSSGVQKVLQKEARRSRRSLGELLFSLARA